LSLKALLRLKGIDVPKIHDVGDILLEFKERFSPSTRKVLLKLKRISRYLRKERELSFYGDLDFIPTERYTKKYAQKAIADAFYVVKIVEKESKINMRV